MPKYIKFVQGEQFMYERFRQLMEERGITSYRVSKDTGIINPASEEYFTLKCTRSAHALKHNKIAPEPKSEGVIVALLQS